jgi:hypothetical protein
LLRLATFGYGTVLSGKTLDTSSALKAYKESKGQQDQLELKVFKEYKESKGQQDLQAQQAKRLEFLDITQPMLR